ncbi:hypothetical protein [Aeromonas veronii]|uniref:Uncharacterized protein n=1 Tax=Aeromonas veronii TaxID=654 RepID=A0A4S5CGH4_AERVE|nr:hypothetical protein [Aeromonas veronii]THJ44927.1 hypothetical protein E8Q35_12105 [Aeromonas veronii]
MNAATPINQITSAKERSPQAVAVATEWAAEFTRMGMYAIKAQSICDRVSPCFMAGWAKFHSNVEVIDSWQLFKGGAAHRFLIERVLQVTDKEIVRINEKYGHIYEVTRMEFHKVACLLERLTKEVDVIQSMGLVMMIVAESTPSEMEQIFSIAIANDLSALDNHRIHNFIAYEERNKVLLAIRRYISLNEQAREKMLELHSLTESKNMEENLQWFSFAIEHVFYPEKIKELIEEASDATPLHIVSKLKEGLQDKFKSKISQAGQEQGKPVRIEFKLWNNPASKEIKNLHRLIECAYLIMGEHNPNQHLLQFLSAADDSAGTNIKGSNGQSVRVFKEVVKTTLSADSVDKLLALLDAPSDLLVDMVRDHARPSV